jgi:hypothetical protein
VYSFLWHLINPKNGLALTLLRKKKPK